MNHEDKPMALASLPDNWSAINAREVLPWQMSRADAAAILRRARSLRARGQARISVESVGRYRLSTFNTLILQTWRCWSQALAFDKQPACGVSGQVN